MSFSHPLAHQQEQQASLARIHRNTHRNQEGVLISYNQPFANDRLSRCASVLLVLARHLDATDGNPVKAAHAVAKWFGFHNATDALHQIEERTTSRYFYHSPFLLLAQTIDHLEEQDQDARQLANGRPC